MALLVGTGYYNKDSLLELLNLNEKKEMDTKTKTITFYREFAMDVPANGMSAFFPFDTEVRISDFGAVIKKISISAESVDFPFYRVDAHLLIAHEPSSFVYINDNTYEIQNKNILMVDTKKPWEGEIFHSLGNDYRLEFMVTAINNSAELYDGALFRAGFCIEYEVLN